MQLMSETSIRGSTESSEASTRADAEERREARRERREEENRRKLLEGSGAIAGSQCTRDTECQGRCRDSRCEDVPAPGPARECEADQTCGAGRICRDFACVGADPVVVPPLQCTTGEQCQPGQGCTNGQCLSLPPSPPSSSLQRQGSEIYLRDRAVQLRQDLALGEGPVISTLASMQGVSAGALGRALRAQREELIAVMGDGADPTWMGRFLRRVEALSEQRAEGPALQPRGS